MRNHFGGIADQYCIAVPAHGISLHVERNRAIIAVHFQQLFRNGRGARAKAAIRFLQRDDIGINLVQHIDDAARIAASVRANTFVNIVACDLQHETCVAALKRVDAVALLLQQGMGGHGG